MDTEARFAKLEALAADTAARVADLEANATVGNGGSGYFPDDVERIKNALVGQGWAQMPSDGTLVRARRAGVPEATIIEHYAAVYRKLPPAPTHLVNILRIDKSLYPYLLDGTGIGYVPWLATDEENQKLFGYTQADVDAASTANPEKYIDNFPLFKSSGGTEGFSLRERGPDGYYK